MTPHTPAPTQAPGEWAYCRTRAHVNGCQWEEHRIRVWNEEKNQVKNGFHAESSIENKCLALSGMIHTVTQDSRNIKPHKLRQIKILSVLCCSVLARVSEARYLNDISVLSGIFNPSQLPVKWL